MEDELVNFPKNEQELRTFLPEGIEYRIDTFSVCSSTEGAGFETKFAFDVKSTDELNEWQKKFEEKTKTTYRVRDSKSAGTVYVLKRRLGCHRNTKSTATSNTVLKSKNTNCPSIMTVKLKKPFPGDNYLECCIDLSFIHNHALGSYIPPRLRKPVAQQPRKKCNKLQTLVLQDATAGICNIPSDQLRIILTMQPAKPPSESDTAVQCLEQLPDNVSDLGLIDNVPNFIVDHIDNTPTEQMITVDTEPDYTLLLQEMFEDIQRHLIENPGIFGPPVLQFCDAFKSMATLEEKVAALFSFGKRT